MAITTMDGLVAALGTSQSVDTFEQSMTSKGAGTYQSLWTAGGRPGAGVTPNSAPGTVATSATAGAIPFTNPSGGPLSYLSSLSISSTLAQTVILYDRLVQSSNLSGTVITAQTVGTPALTRHTSGANVGLWLEWYTATGSTATTATITYTNQAGTSGRTTTVAFPASPVAGQMVPVPLASGDTGVQAVASVQLAASTLTAGSFGVTLAYRIAQIPIIAANYGIVLDYASLGMPQIADSSCLAFKVLCTTTTTGTILSAVNIVQG